MTITGTPIALPSVLSASDIVTLMTAEHQWMSQSIDSEPMTGLVNGSNRVFSVSFTPASSITVADYLGNELGVLSSNGDTGVVVLENPPINTVFASYQHTVVKPSYVNGIASAAVSFMESLWTRGYSMVESSGSYYLSSDPLTVVDDTIYSSLAQRKFLADCVFYTWVRSYYLEATMNSIAYREQRASGLNIDRSRQPQAFDAMLKLARDNVETSMKAAMTEAGEDAYGTLVPGRATSQQPNSGWYYDNIFPYP